MFVRLFLLVLSAACGLAAAARPAPAEWYPYTIEPAVAAQRQPAAWPRPAPLTAADRIEVAGSQFHRVGADGIAGTADDQRVRFFGVNLSFGANLPDATYARQLAHTLASLGVNAVRLHHLDTRLTPVDQPPRGVLTPGPYPSWHPDGIARLRHLIQALAEVGIYTNLNLRVGYVFRPDVDQVPAYDPATLQRANATPIAVYHPELVRRQQRYAAELIAALGLRHHPALAMVEISNEASLLAAWYRNEWQDAVPPAYAPVLEARWNAWLIARYGSISQACQAWGGCEHPDRPAYLISPADVTAPTGSAQEWLQRATRAGRDWLRTTWDMALVQAEPTAADARTHDFLRFLAHEDARYFGALKSTIREAAGFAVAVTGTQMGYGGPLNHLANADMDYLDDHFYVDHPHFPEGHAGQTNWRIWNLSLRDREASLLLRHALRREWGKPFVVSEFNQPYPSQAGGEILPLFVSLAALQDWDGVFFFEYANRARSESAPANFALEGDWGKWVQLAQAARLFRLTPPNPLPEAQALVLNETDQATLTRDGKLDAVAELARTRLGLDAQAVWRYRLGIQTHSPPGRAGLARPEAPAVALADSHWSLNGANVHVVATPAPSPGQAPLPWQPLSFSASQASLPVTPWLTQIPGAPLPTWQLSLGTATVGSQPGALPARPKRYVPHPYGQDSVTLEPDPYPPGAIAAPRHAQGPAWLPRLPLSLHWRVATQGQRLKVYPLDGRGQRMAALPPSRIQRHAEGFSIQLHASPAETSPWFEWVLEPELP